MRIFIDEDFKCHAEPAEGLRGFDIPFFDGKCTAFIEGYRYVPEGETWRYKGHDFMGEMISPWKDYNILEMAQQTADRVQEQADAQIMELLDVIVELIIGG